MAETSTIRVTFNDESLEMGWKLNPAALNEPELVRHFYALGLLKSIEIAGGEAADLGDLGDVEVELAGGEDETDTDDSE